MLLRGDAANPAADAGPVAGLLAAASAPARARELLGEAEAVAAFCAAHLHPITRPRRSSMSVTKLLIAKAALAAMGLSGGGVALAAATGHLHAGPGGAFASGSAGTSASSVGASPAQTHRSSNSPSPSPSMRGLCQAYTSRGDNPGKALENPAFSALIRAAGGKDNVSAYCTRELASKPGNSNKSHGHAGNPPGRSGDHSVGKPTSHP
jgi:hypothetical protein